MKKDEIKSEDWRELGAICELILVELSRRGCEDTLQKLANKIPNEKKGCLSCAHFELYAQSRRVHSHCHVGKIVRKTANSCSAEALALIDRMGSKCSYYKNYRERDMTKEQMWKTQYQGNPLATPRDPLHHVIRGLYNRNPGIKHLVSLYRTRDMTEEDMVASIVEELDRQSEHWKDQVFEYSSRFGSPVNRL